MTAIFTGFGAGLERGSGSALGGGGLFGSSSLGRGGEAVFVNAANGNLILSRQDEFLAGLGPDIAISRTYNSVGALDDNGDYWRQSSDRRVFGLVGALNTAGSSIKRVSGDGSEITYAWNGAAYIATGGAGAYDRLTFASNVWTWTDGDSRITETYAGHGADNWRISEQRSADGLNHLSFAYSGDKLVSVTTKDGASISYAWSGNDITSIVTSFTEAGVAKTLTRTRYEYDASHRLIKVIVDLSPEDNSVSDANTYWTSYAYDGTSNRITSVTQKDGSALVITYDAQNRVEWLRQTVADPSDTRTTRIVYSSDGAWTDVRSYTLEYAGEATPYVSTRLYHDAAEQLTKVEGPAPQGSAQPLTVQYGYDGNGNVISVADAAGVTTYGYDAAGNVVQVTDPNNNIVTRLYSSENRLTRETRTGSTAAGGAQTLYSRFAYNGAKQMRYSVSAEGHVTEYRYTGAGLLEYTIEYVDHVFSTTDPSPSDNALDAWRTNLATTGQLAGARIVRNYYDPRGNLIETRSYGAANDAGVAVETEGYRKDTFQFDQSGQLLSRSTGGQPAETFIYDGLGRIVLSTDLAGGKTKIFFDDAATTTTVTTRVDPSTNAQTGASYVVVSTYNKAGELISRADTGGAADGNFTNGGTAAYAYDKLGRLRMTTDASARKSWLIHDDTGRKIAEVGHDGQVAEYFYDQAGRVTGVGRYYNKLTAAQLTTLSDPLADIDWGSAAFARPALHSYDIWQWSVYDAGGRVIETIQGDGSVTAYAYDGADRLVRTTSYFTKLASVAAYKTAPPAALVLPTADVKDRISRTFFDGDGRVIGALNAEGALSRVVYDGAGRKIQDLAYANLTAASLRATGSFDALAGSFTADAARDASTRYIYDAQGQLRFTIDPLNRVTEYVYAQETAAFATGLVRKTVSYATPLGSVANYRYGTIKLAAAALATVPANDRASYGVYDNRGQLIYTVDATGAVTRLEYDSSGRVIKLTQFAKAFEDAMGADHEWEAKLNTFAAANPTGARVTRNYYAERGELRFVVDALGYVTRNDYDTEGRLLDVFRFANAISVDDTTTIGQVSNADKGAWAKTMYRYDNVGRLQDIYDANGSRRSKVYFSTGLLAYDIEAWGQGLDEKRVQYYYDQAGKLTTKREWTSEATNASSIGASGALMTQAQRLLSPSGFYSAVLTREGELRIYHKGELVWTNGVRDTTAGATFRLVAQTDGNLVIYRDVSGQPQVGVWASNTAGQHSGATFMALDDSGNISLQKGTAPTSTGQIWQGGAAGAIAQDPNAAEYYDTNFTYDGLGNVLTVKDARNNVTTFTYDKVGRVKTQKDQLNGVTTYEYDALGRGVKTIDASNNATYSYFDKASRVVAVLDAEGYVTATSYNAFGEVASVTRQYNREYIQFVNGWPAGGTGLVLTRETIDGRLSWVARNDHGEKPSWDQVQAWGGGVSVLNGDRGDGAISVQAGDTLNFSFQAMTLDAGVTVYARFAYLKSDGTWAEGGNITATGDGWKTLAGSTTAPAGAIAVHLGIFALRGDGNIDGGFDFAMQGLSIKKNGVELETGVPAAKAHALDAATHFEYDKLGRLTKTTDAEQGVERYKLNAFGERAEVTNKLGGVTKYTFDLLGRAVLEELPINSINGDGSVQAAAVFNKFEYDSRGNLTKKIEAFNLTEQRTTIFEYDAGDRLVRIKGDAVSVNASGVAANETVTPTEQFFYDRRGNLIEKIASTGARTLFWYDKLDRLTHEVSALGTLTRHFYDKVGNRVETRVYATPLAQLPADAKGLAPTGGPLSDARIEKHSYDALNRLIETRTPGILIARYGLPEPPDPAGPARLWVKTQDLVRSYQYDALGHLTRVTDANAKQVNYTYDKMGRRLSQIDAENYRTDWTYDANGNAVSERRYAARNAAPLTADDPVGEDRVTKFTYDKLGRRLTATRRGVAIYGENAGAVSQTLTDAVVSYLYNALGQVTRKTESTGDQINYSYDAGGRLITEARAAYTDFTGALVTPTVDYAYNGLNALARTRQRGATTSDPTTTTLERNTVYAYALGGRLTSITDAGGLKRTFRYDAAGRVTREEYNRINLTGPADEAVGYEYDLEGRVVKQGMLLYVANAWTRTGANIDTVMMKYNAFGELSERGINDVYAEKFEYDKAGRVWRTTAGDGGFKYFMYDRVGNSTLAFSSAGANIDQKTIAEILALWDDPTVAGDNVDTIATRNIAGVTASITLYDGRNQATEVREPQRERGQGFVDDLVTTRAYNAFGEVAYELNASGGRIDYTYNTMGRTIRIESPEVFGVGENGKYIIGYVGDAPKATGAADTPVMFRPVEQRYYDVSGRLVAVRDANGHVTRLQLLAGTGYGGAEALVRATITPDNAQAVTGFDIHGDARKQTDQLGRVTRQSFDGMGRVSQIEKPSGLKDYYRYDGLGQRTKHWNSLYNPTYNVATDPNGTGAINAETVTYDQQGRVLTYVAMGGDTTTYTYSWSSALSTAGMGQFGGWIQTTKYANDKVLTEHNDPFGRSIAKTDLGAHQTGFVYDKAGRLIQRTGGQTLSYAYYNTGRVSETFIHTSNTQGWNKLGTVYGYDKSGNVIREKMTRVGVVDYWTQGYMQQVGYNPYEPEYEWVEPEHIYYEINQLYSDANASYDGLGRLVSWSELGNTTEQPNRPPASISYKYDANGNIRMSKATFRTLNATGVASANNAPAQEYWYRYDALNRVVTQKGMLQNGAIVRGDVGAEIVYDDAGQRKYSLTSFNDVYYTWEEFYEWPESHSYQVAHNFVNVRREDYTYDAGGRLTQVNVAQGYYDEWDGQVYAPTGAGGRRAAFVYDAMDRMTSQIDYELNGTTVAFSRSLTYNAKSQLISDISDTKRGNVVYRNSSSFNYGSGTSYALGAALTITTGNYQNMSLQNTSLTTNFYQWWDGAVQDKIEFKPNQNQTPKNTTTYAYQQIGGQAQLFSVYVQDGRPRSISFTNDMQGQVMRRDEQDNSTATNGDPHEVYYRFAGKQVGYVGNNGSLDTSYADSIANRQVTQGTGSFRNGAAYGISHADFDQSVSQINSYFQGSAGGAYTVQTGDTLQTIAAKLWGDASLWWKLAEANGLSAESALAEGQTLMLPTGVIKSKHNASTFKPYDPGEVVGDTAPTTPIQPKPKKNKCGGLGAIILAVIAIVVTIWTAGATSGFFAGVFGSTGGAIVTGAVSAAAGSIVSQGIGVATGIQEKFSWNAVALAAIGGGVGGGIGQIFGKAETMMGAALRGVANSALTQGIGVATGLQDKFSWAAVAAAGVGGAVGFKVGKVLGAQSLQEDQSWRNIAANTGVTMATAVASAATQSLVDGSDFGDNVMAALPSAIGQTIGELIAGSISGAIREARLQRDIEFLQSLPAAEGYDAADIREAARAYGQFQDAAADIGDGESERLAAQVATDAASQEALLSLGQARAQNLELSTVSQRATTFVESVAGAQAAADTQQALSNIIWSDEIIVWGRSSGDRNGPSRSLVSYAVDVLEGVGRGVDYINQRIDQNRLLHYSLVALDIASGPVAWAARSIVMASPVGAMLGRAAGRAASWVAGKMADAVGGQANLERIYYAASGAIFLATTALGVRTALRHFRSAARHLGDEGFCFVAGTLVATKAGARAIETVKLGELVLARDEKTGATAFKPVLKLIRNRGTPVWSVLVTVDGHEERIGVTAEHPWRVLDGKAQWLATSELRPGMSIERIEGAPAEVVSVAETGEVAATFNFEVGDFHTYFVGENALWVHNTYRAQPRDVMMGRDDAEFSVVVPGRLTNNAALRTEWERRTGQTWPIDPATGRNADVSHRVPLADGGPDHVDNIEPLTHADHVAEHMANDDFSRWARRRY